AQSTLGKEKEFVEASNDRFWYLMLFLVAACLAGGAFYFWRKRGKGTEQPQNNYSSRKTDYNGNASYEIEDGDKELEWLRKAKKPSSRTPKKGVATTRSARATNMSPIMGNSLGDINTKLFQEKMKKLQYSQ